VAFGYVHLQLDDEVRRQAEQLLARHYTDLRVEVGSARLLKGRGIELFDVDISRTQPKGERQTLLSVENLFLECSTDLDDLVAGNLGIRRMTMKRAALHATRDAGNTWSTATLWPPPSLGDSPPVVEVTAGKLLLKDATGAYSQPFTAQGIDVTLTPELVAPASASSPLSGGPSLVYHISATSTDSPAKHVRIEGRASPDDGRIDLEMEVRDLEVTPESIASLAAAGIGVPAGLDLHGVASGKIHVSREAGSADPPEVACQFNLADGRFTHARLPRPLSELNVQGHCDRSRLVITQLTGKCGAADVSLACERAGWDAQAPLGLRARVLGLPIDKRLRSVIPDTVGKHWDRYDPAGLADADLELTYDGRHWQPTLTAQVRQAEFTETEHFPYRLEQGTGKLVFQQTADQPGGQLSINVVGMGQDRPIRLVVELTNIPLGDAQPTDAAGQLPARPLGWAEVSGTAIPVHEQLIAAMKPGAQRVVQSLHAEGHFDFRWRAERLSATQGKPDIGLDITLNGCAIAFDGFPYQVRDIHGQVTSRNDVWKFENLESRNPNRDVVVTASGQLVPDTDGKRLQLTINANNVALDGELRRALEPRMQEVWSQLKPQGRINFTALVDHQSVPDEPTKPDIRVAVWPHQRSVSIEPAFLSYPYRLEQLDGQFNFVDGKLSMTDVQARHGRVELSTNGAWQPTADGGWQLDFRDLRADHLTASRDLLLALPPRLQNVISGLRPNGTFALYQSAFSFRKPADPAARLATSWNLNLECQQSDLQCGTLLEDVSGSVRLVGTSDGNEGYSSGELALDSLVWHNIQLTAIQGPLWIDQSPTGSTVLLGRGASERQQQRQQQLSQPRQPLSDMRANVYGGMVVGSIHVRNEGIPHFDLTASLAGADLRQYALERLGGRSDVTGTINGRLQLENTGTSTDAMTGRGELHLVDANIYRLPQLVALLKVLQNRTPDTTAFNRCDSEFTIRGQHLTFQQFNLLGDAVSFYGTGDSTLAGDDLNLVFRTEMGRRQIPVISSLMGQAQAQIVQIRVDGTAQDPVFRPETLPGVKKTIEQIQAELQPLVAPEPRSAESRFPFWPFRK
jgi:hypothetical protein